MSEILDVGRWKQEGQKFKVTLSYLGSFRDPVLIPPPANHTRGGFADRNAGILVLVAQVLGAWCQAEWKAPRSGE